MARVECWDVQYLGGVTLVTYPDKAVLKVRIDEDYVFENFTDRTDLLNQVNKKLADLIEVEKMNEDHEIYKQCIQWKGRE